MNLSHELLQAYRLFQMVSQYPELAESIRDLFLAQLLTDGHLTAETFESELTAQINRAREAGGEKAAPEEVAAEKTMLRGLLTDLWFARYYDLRRAEDLIHLARKRESMRQLTILLNRPEVSRGAIRKQVEEFCRLPVGDTLLDQTQMEGVRVHLIRMFITDQLSFLGTAKKYIWVRDMNHILQSTIGHSESPGLIGGKAAGLNLALRILLPTYGGAQEEDFQRYVTCPESSYVASDVFAEFVNNNELVDAHTWKYREIDEIRRDFPQLVKRFKEAEIPEEFRGQMRAFLAKVGKRPLIVRSSSHLEDNYQFSFAGKYESVFLANQGALEKRLKQLLEAVKTVYVSVYGPDPISYRKKNGLLDYNENMALTIQSVVGRRFGDYFFPFAAGVGYSQNPYRWSSEIRREDGFLRLVFGLGTRAVARSEHDYARLVPLSHPSLRTEVGARNIARYSQHLVDLLNLKTSRVEAVPTADLLPQINHPEIGEAVSINEEGHLYAPLTRQVNLKDKSFCLTFDNLLQHRPFVAVMRKMLRRLEEAHGQPVDIEFAYDDGKIYLLQCRILHGSLADEPVTLPENLPAEDVVFRFGSFFAGRRLADLQLLVFVDPQEYRQLARQDKARVARAVGALNSRLRGRRYALIGPGRWGSNNIELGVGTTYADLSNCLLLGELVFAREDATPEVSYGTHFFQDLIEANILPLSIVVGRNDDCFDLQMARAAPNELPRLLPEFTDLDSCVRVLDLPRITGGRSLEVILDGKTSRGVAFLARPAGIDSARA